MKHIKVILLCLGSLSMIWMLCSCWNYREIDQLAIVAGVAVDQGTTHTYKVSIEIIEMSAGRDATPKSRIVSSEGNSMFDAVRNEIAVSGKRLYWSHAKVIIINKALAEKGVVKIIDWYSRDSETRSDVNILISGEDTAEEILKSSLAGEEITSIGLYDMVKNESSLSKAPNVEIWKFINDLVAEGIAPIAPEVLLEKGDGKPTPHLGGSAIFRHDELLGFLNDEDTKYLLFIRNEVKKGVITPIESGKEGEAPIALEIFKNSTKVKTLISSGTVQVHVNSATEVAIDEIDGSENFIEDKGRHKLESDTEKLLRTRFEEVIEKVQSQFGVDAFGFGSKLRQNNPKQWKKLSADWEQTFRKLRVSVNAKVHIRNSALLSKTIEVGD